MDNSFKIMKKLNKEINKEVRKYRMGLFFGSVFPIFSRDESLPGIAITLKTIVDILFLITASLSVFGNEVLSGLYLFFACVTGGVSTVLTSMYHHWAKEDMSYDIENIKQEILEKYKICEKVSTYQNQHTESKEINNCQTNIKSVETKMSSIAPVIHDENIESDLEKENGNVKVRVRKPNN